MYEPPAGEMKFLQFCTCKLIRGLSLENDTGGPSLPNQTPMRSGKIRKAEKRGRESRFCGEDGWVGGWVCVGMKWVGMPSGRPRAQTLQLDPHQPPTQNRAWRERHLMYTVHAKHTPLQSLAETQCSAEPKNEMNA